MGTVNNGLLTEMFMNVTNNRLSILTILAAAACMLLLFACGGGDSGEPEDIVENTEVNTGGGNTDATETGTDGETDTGTGSTEGVEPHPETKACAADYAGCCDDQNTCTTGECWKRNATDVSGICISKPVAESMLYWEDYIYDQEDGKKDGTFRQILDNQDAPVPVDLSCAPAGADDLNETALTSLDAKVKVFGVKAPCSLLKVDIFYQYDDQGVPVLSFDQGIIPTANVTAEPDEEGICSIKIDGVPVNRWLVFKSYDTDNVQFVDTYQFNIYIPKADANTDTGYKIEINAISQTSWNMIPVTIGVANGIQSDRAAVAGTIRDCNDRLLKNATVGANIRPTKLGYFNANVADLLPDPLATNTNSDGTFALVDIPTGLTRLVAQAMVNGQVVTINVIDFVTFPGSVSIAAMDGGQSLNHGIFVKPTTK